MQPTSLYIHIPFCHKKCPYCAFVKDIWTPEAEEKMVQALITEMQHYAQKWPKLAIRTLFLGGGTPSSLSAPSLNRLFEAIYTLFDMPISCEKTIEMNPESVSIEKLTVLNKFHINRVSLGVQSLDTQELAFLGRQHTPGRIDKVMAMLADKGITNVNLDFIFGLPNASIETLQKTLTHAVKLNPTHISTYALSIEKGTPFHQKKQDKATQEAELKQYQFIRRFLGQHGYKHYEVSAFAKKGYTCQHNLAYWHLTPFIGIGPSGASFFNQCHYTQTSNLDAYIQNPMPPLLQKRCKPLPKSQMLKDYLVANLRRLDGVVFQDIQDRFGIDLYTSYQKEIDTLVQQKLLKRTPKRMAVTTKGLYILDTVLEAFL